MTQNNVTVRQLEAFLTVAETRSFHQAADRVHLSQPALSMSIRRLEEAVGARLFDRTTRTVELTPEGREFEAVARRLVEDWQAAFSGMSDLIRKRRGRVAVAALPSIAAGLLPVALARFRTEYPGIDLGVRDVLADEVLNLVRGDKADIGFSVDPGEVEGLVFQPLLSDRFIALLPADHPLALRQHITWDDLADLPFIGMSRTTSVRQRLETVQAQLRRRPNNLCEVEHLATVAGMVAAGLGVSAVPSLCLPVMLREGLVWRPLTSPGVERRLGLITRAGRSLSVAAQAFADWLRVTVADPAGLGPGWSEMVVHTDRG